MVERVELAVVFIAKNPNEEITQFIPTRVIEGTYDKENNWFNDTIDGVTYLHLEIVHGKQVGYGCRMVIDTMKGSVSPDRINELKDELFNYVNQFNYIRDKSRGDTIITIKKGTSEENIFKDLDSIPEYLPNKSKRGSGDILEMTPLEIETEIKKTIKGQDAAIRKIVTALWTTMNFRDMRKKNMLIIGPSGVGKTAIFEKIKEILDIPVVIFSVPGLSQAGYVGRSVDEILKQVYYDSNFNLDDAERSIVILDEIDKIASSNGGDISTSSVQNELLKIIEGCDRYVESQGMTESSFSINTSDIIFIGTGAFQELFEKEKPLIGYSNRIDKPEEKKIDTERLVNYGMKRELIGRLPIMVTLNNLGKDEFREIVMESDESELMHVVNSLRILNVEIENLDDLIDIIVTDAVNKQIGARGLILTINDMFQEIFYEVANHPDYYEKVIVGTNIISDPFDFELIERKSKKRIKIK